MTDTSVDLEQLRGVSRQLRAIAEGDLSALINDHSELLKTYRGDASANTVDGAPAGIYADTVAVLESGVHDVSTKFQAMKAELLKLADHMDAHAQGVDNDESDASQKFTYGTTT
ncbi:hypothetical protein [Mycobacterium intracellulare]|uniref:PE domain-containing protein n=1 Tax=Mycobacterium intracellulare subsp. chimaera TaxID=222805 RepID=A0A7U5MRJ0_MYCIT|nr:hypothetical protein [Mycobacterium intracellulare]ASL18387.1 hypothetical protein MYCOZU2_06042 [Mycobacterium intracellulare subsp. chimaera]